MTHALKRFLVLAGIALAGAGFYASAAHADGDMYLMFGGPGFAGMGPGHGRNRPDIGPGSEYGPGEGRHGGLGLGRGGWIGVKSFKWGDKRGHTLSGSNARDIFPQSVGPGSLTARLDDDGPGMMLEQYCGADVPLSSVYIQVAGPRSGNAVTAYALHHVTLKCKGSSMSEITMIYEAADLPSPAGLKRRDR